MSSIHLVVSDGEEKAAGETFSAKCNSDSTVFWDHSLMNCISYATSKKNIRRSRCNVRGSELLTSTRKVVKVFTKSPLNTERLQQIQRERILAKRAPFKESTNTSLLTELTLPP